MEQKTEQKRRPEAEQKTEQKAEKKTGSKKNRAGKAAGLLGLMAAPAVSYVAFEYVTGNLPVISFHMAVLNICWMAALYLAVLAVSGRSRIAVPLVSLVLYLLSLAETFVISFRGMPIMLWDVLAIPTAMTVAGNYALVFSAEMKTAAVVLLVFNLLVWFFPLRIRGWKYYLGFLTGSTGVIAAFIIYFFSYTVPGQHLGISMWEMGETYKNCGFVLSTAVSLQYFIKKPPVGYSHGTLKALSEYFAEEAELASDCVQPVNLICIMNESLSELRVAGDFSVNQEYFPFINNLKENTVKGSLCVPVFGSMTSNSEFEFLTGDSMAVLPSGVNAYQFYIKPGALSLVSTLKDQGYEAVAMHPYPAGNWNRDTCYENMGFDEFLSLDYFENCETLRTYVTDKADFQKVIQRVEEKKNPEDRLFIFNVTMQNHGGYGNVYEDFSQDVCLTAELEGKYPMADQYLPLMKRSDEAFQYLLEYFSACDEPTMIVMFGDHQPSVENEFYDEIAGRPSWLVPDEEWLMWYQTPFIIWTNYEQPSADMGKLGDIYLSSYVLKLANLEMTPYNRFLLHMSQALPVVHPIGCYEEDGAYYSWAEAEKGSYGEMVLNYEYMAYNHSMDSRKETGLFRIDAQTD